MKHGGPPWFERRGVLWVVPPKCGSTTMAEVLGCDREMTRDEARAWEGEVVAVVRHPWDRLVSVKHSLLDGKTDFADWADFYILDRPPENMDIHVRPIWWYLDGITPTTVVHLDRIEAEWPVVRKRYGVGDLRHLNRGVSRPAGWQSTGYHFEIVRPIYEPSFTLGGYAD